MNKIIIIFIIAMLAIATVVVVASVGGEYFENPFGDPINPDDPAFIGDWGQELWVVYEDGTEESLTMIANNPVQQFLRDLGVGVYVEDKKVAAIKYIVSAKATGDDGSTVTFDRPSMNFDIISKAGSKYSGTTHKTYSWTSDWAYGPTKTIDVDGKWHEIFADKWIPLTRIYTVNDGNYRAWFEMVGDVKYKIDDGAWQTDIGRPAKVYLAYEVKDENGGGGAQIVINFDAGSAGTV